MILVLYCGNVGVFIKILCCLWVWCCQDPRDNEFLAGVDDPMALLWSFFCTLRGSCKCVLPLGSWVSLIFLERVPWVAMHSRVVPALALQACSEGRTVCCRSSSCYTQVDSCHDDCQFQIILSWLSVIWVFASICSGFERSFIYLHCGFCMQKISHELFFLLSKSWYIRVEGHCHVALLKASSL